jgi:hypothetical protein
VPDAGRRAGERPQEIRAGGQPVTVPRYEDLPSIGALDELVALVENSPHGQDAFVRWSRGPDVDVATEAGAASSKDSLTEMPLPARCGRSSASSTSRAGAVCAI